MENRSGKDARAAQPRTVPEQETPALVDPNEQARQSLELETAEGRVAFQEVLRRQVHRKGRGEGGWRRVPLLLGEGVPVGLGGRAVVVGYMLGGFSRLDEFRDQLGQVGGAVRGHDGLPIDFLPAGGEVLEGGRWTDGS